MCSDICYDSNWHDQRHVYYHSDYKDPKGYCIDDLNRACNVCYAGYSVYGVSSVDSNYACSCFACSCYDQARPETFLSLPVNSVGIIKKL